MKIGRLVTTVLSATAMLAAVASTASAGRFSSSASSFRATWSRMDFSGSFGTVECEVVLEGTLHARSITKTAGTLVGYLTAANTTRCAGFGETILRETLPWHIQYHNFAGTLPTISGIRTKLIGYSFRIREPAFGATCLVRSTIEEPALVTFNRETGAVGTLTSATIGGSIRCRGPIEVTGGLSGSSSSLTSAEGARLTVTLI